MTCYERQPASEQERAARVIRSGVIIALTALSMTGSGGALFVFAASDPMALGAFITSEHAVYTAGEAVDVTFWVRKPEGSVTVALEVRNGKGRLFPEKTVKGKTLATFKNRGPDGRIPPTNSYVETVPDLRQWYDISTPGTYSIKFIGEDSRPDGTLERVASNTLTIYVRTRADSSDRVIPLKDVWALNMPGVRPMNLTMRGEPLTYESPEGPLVAEILRVALKYEPGKRPIVEEGFAVRGEGMDALRESHAVLVHGQRKRTSFRKGERISLAFFSYSFGSYVHLVRVEQRSNVIQLSYRFVPHRTREMTAHFALIPLPNPGGDRIQVEVKPQIDSAALALDWGQWARKIVCGSFVLNVA